VDPEAGLNDSISRRSALKRIGAGAAIAWSVPVLTSLNTPAYAQASAAPCGGSNCLQGCTGSLQCGEGCYCMQRHSDKACVCIGGGICRTCSTDEDCTAVTGPGSTCVDVDPENCCIGTGVTTACQPPCGAPLRAIPRDLVSNP
jgi:hypothetical protein